MIDGLGVYGSNTGGVDKTKKADEAMGKDAFLKLLVTQLENQDPLNPTDNTEFVAQLAQFSSLEGIQNLNTSFAGVKGSMEALQSYGSVSLIGKNARAEASTFVFDGAPRTLGFSVPSNATSAALVVKDPSGRDVRHIDLGAIKQGYAEAEWNGLDNSGASARTGLYNFSLEARGADNKPIKGSTFINGAVTGVSLTGGQALKIDGLEVASDRVAEIY